jgi:lysophospholipase L1-like esterase
MGMKLKIKLFASVLLLICFTAALGQNNKRDINIVFIGNSITQGVQLKDRATEAPPATAVAWLREHKKLDTVEFSNQGHSGYTTLDFLPGAGITFTNVEAAARAFTNQQALLVFSIKLGTNDSAVQGPHGAPVSPENYINNLKTIADRLLADFPQSIMFSRATKKHSTISKRTMPQIWFLKKDSRGYFTYIPIKRGR